MRMICKANQITVFSFGEWAKTTQCATVYSTQGERSVIVRLHAVCFFIYSHVLCVWITKSRAMARVTLRFVEKIFDGSSSIATAIRQGYGK